MRIGGCGDGAAYLFQQFVLVGAEGAFQDQPVAGVLNENVGEAGVDVGLGDDLGDVAGDVELCMRAGGEGEEVLVGHGVNSKWLSGLWS